MIELKKTTKLAWFRFLRTTDQGAEGLLFLNESIPSITGKDSSEIIFNAGIAEGFRRALATLTEMIAAEPKSSNEDYDNK